jgi:acetylornithine deacetylase
MCGRRHSSMNNSLKKKIKNEVEQRAGEVVMFLQQLIRINSQTGKEKQIQEFLADNLGDIGLKVDKFIPEIELLKRQPGYVPIEVNFENRPNVVGIMEGTGGGKSLILNGHVDTITAEPIDAWDPAPFSGELREGKIFGRGASDMKSGIAAMTMAVKILKQMKLTMRGSVTLEYVVDEEITGYGTLACIARGYRADAGICCESSDLCIQPACIGRLWFYIDVIGKTSGISNKWESVSPIEKALKIVEAVNDLEKMRIEDLDHPLFPDKKGALPCTVCVFNSGTYPSAIPEKARLEGSMGTMPYETVEEVREQLIGQIRRVAEADPWMRHHPPQVSFRPTGGYGAEIPVEHPIVKTLKQAFQETTGMAPTVSGRMGGSDTKYLIPYGNIPTVIFGPGSTAQMHATNENVTIENLMVAVETIALAIYDWCT